MRQLTAERESSDRKMAEMKNQLQSTDRPEVDFDAFKDIILTVHVVRHVYNYAHF